MRVQRGLFGQNVSKRDTPRTLLSQNFTKPPQVRPMIEKWWALPVSRSALPVRWSALPLSRSALPVSRSALPMPRRRMIVPRDALPVPRRRMNETLVTLTGRMEASATATRRPFVARAPAVGESQRDSVTQPRVGALGAYPGCVVQNDFQPQRGCILSFRRGCCNPFRVVNFYPHPTQGSSPTRNPGLSAAIPLGLPGSRAGRAGDDTPEPARKTRLTRGGGRRNVARLAPEYTSSLLH